MNPRVLVLRNRSVQVHSKSVININPSLPQLNSTVNSESCLNTQYNYQNRLQILNGELLNQSLEIDRALSPSFSKMAYEFPTEKAMLCIPQYHGAAKKLDGFLFQVEYFANQIPRG